MVKFAPVMDRERKMKKLLALLVCSSSTVFAAPLPDAAQMGKIHQQCDKAKYDAHEPCLTKAGLSTFKRNGTKLEIPLSKGKKVYKNNLSEGDDAISYAYEDYLPEIKAHALTVWLYEESQSKILFESGKEITLGGPFKLSPGLDKALWVNLIEGYGTAGIVDLKTGKMLWSLPDEIPGQPVYGENDTSRNWPFSWKSNSEAEILWSCDYDKTKVRLVLQQVGSNWKLKGSCPKTTK
ncbi:hypothetical protein LIN78_00145 [Leeia sp. TBRC 13508]|uniref:Uncharacterized protein n=1 Tax=Leeia speluncae TaxID=2884804 RepID=A0ABS8D195_9NEIS|nr:hypothetical protein [Leeia speluncae]MCB6181965.1 hypothetical protein [Leeia speluncae]